MMPLSPQLQQHWQTVADRLPTDFPVAELSPQARSVMAFSDFVEQSVIAQPGWLNELADSAPAAEEWRHYEAWLQERLQAVTDEAGLMRAASLPPPDDGPHRLGAGVVAGARRRDAAAAERPGGDPDCRRPRLAVRRLL